MMLLAMPCLYLCVYFHAIWLDPCLHILICLDPCFHMPMCLDLCPLHASYYLPCAYALHAMFMCLDLGHVCHAMCYYSSFVALSFFLMFWPNG